jgi:hypothetical protein
MKQDKLELLTPKEKAYELVDMFFMPLPLTCQVLTKVNNISFEYDDWEVAKKCALIAVDELIKYSPNKPTEEYDPIQYFKKVKKEIKKL